ncbi:MAG: TonB-dependent receptor [Bacteroidetes bacterium]|nr:TonB-dependent receptor [Bacteroidota bacterium]
MKKIILNILILVFVFGSQQAFSQNAISGNVTDDGNEGLPGVSIIIKDSSQGTLTDVDGNFNLSVPDNNAVLVFSYIGFESQELTVGNQTSFNISMRPDIAQLEEIVVVGYGTQRKRDITGAVSVVDAEEMAKSQFVSITDRLQGRVAGVSVNTTGEPGVKGDIKIRGTAFFGDNNPLFVIDGILTDDSPNLNPNDIESIQVLKDASSAAIYGSRAANGVVVITTKKGTSGTPRITFSSTAGLSSLTRTIDVMNSAEYARISNGASDYSGSARQDETDVLTGIDTDWQQEVFQDNALFQDVNVSIQAGGEKSKVYFSLNNTYQEGVIKGPLFDRVGTRLNTEYTVIKGLTIGQNLTISRARNSGEPNLKGSGGIGNRPVISNTISMLPIIPVLDPSKTNGYGHGVPGVATSFGFNPIGIQEVTRNQRENTRVLGNLYLDYEIIEGLNYYFSAGVNSTFFHNKNWQKGGQIRMTTTHQSGLTEARGESRETFIENRLTYRKSIGDHRFTAMATYTEQDLLASSQETIITGGFDAAVPFFQISATTAPPNQIISSGFEDIATIRSILGRFTYSFADRYLFTANIRRDGNSKFSEGNRWGTFPSISAGWNLTNESFFNVAAISNLKLRVGYGQVGNASLDNFRFQQLIRTASIGGVNYNLGPSSTQVIGATAGDIVNRDIRWEILKETNIGLDLALFDGQLEFIGDIYFGKLEDLLTEVPIPISAGFGGQPTVNAVSMDRNGWEIAMTYRKITGDFQFAITANAFHTNNEVTALPFGVNEFPGTNSISRIGIPLGQLYTPIYEGIYTQGEIDALDPTFTINGAPPLAGDAKYRDINGRDDETGELTPGADGSVSFDDDRALVGNPIPDVQYGLNFSATYKNFDATIFFQGVAGRDAYNSIYDNLNTNLSSNFTSNFNPANLGGTDPNFDAGGFENGNMWNSTRFIENGGYLRLKNLQIGYTIPWDKVSNLRVYVSGQNLFTITDFNGLDPEFSGSVFAPGVDPIGFPNVRILSTGFSLTF